MCMCVCVCVCVYVCVYVYVYVCVCVCVCQLVWCYDMHIDIRLNLISAFVGQRFVCTCR